MKIIGMIHLKTLTGYPQHESMESVIEKAVREALILEEGKVDAILIENTDDDPHQKEVSQEIVAAFTLVVNEVIKMVKVPVGVCVLFNDYKASLAIAKVTGAKFVRIPVFTEAVVTSCGIIEANPYDVISYRDKIKANDVRILADVQVKHAAMLVKRPITESAKETLHSGADEIIITGKFTGDCPNLQELSNVKKTCPETTIIVGSGTTPSNFKELAKYADKVIVGTYFKVNGEINLGRVNELVKLKRG